MNFAERFGTATPFGIQHRTVADALDPIYRRLYEQLSGEKLNANYFQIKVLPGDGSTNRFEINMAVFGIKLFLVDGFLVAGDGFPGSFDKSTSGLYCRVEAFGKANFQLTEQQTRKLLNDLANGVRAAL